MQKLSRKFVFDTPVQITGYAGKKPHLFCYARVEGIGYYFPNSHGDNEQEDDAESLYDFDVEKVLLKFGTEEQDGTLVYRISKAFKDSFCDAIDKPALAHMEYLFDVEVAKHWGNKPVTAISEPDFTDVNQTVYHVTKLVTYDQQSDKVLTEEVGKAA